MLPTSEAPKEIYLLPGSDAGAPDWTQGVTWCDEDATGNGVHYIRADLANAEWRPMATAPRDRTPFQIAFPSNETHKVEIDIVKRLTPESEWLGEVTGDPDADGVLYEDSSCLGWLPLPAPPQGRVE